MNRSERKAEAAQIGFEILGSQAASAVPALIRLITENNTPHAKFEAIQASGYIGQAALPALLAAMTNRSAQIRLEAVVTIGFRGKGWENARVAVPLLLECLKDKDGRLAEMAAYMLGNLSLEPETVVPALANRLQVPGPSGQTGPLLALERFGRAAHSAVPAVLPLLNDADFNTRYMATNTLRAIAPEVFGNTNATGTASKFE